MVTHLDAVTNNGYARACTWGQYSSKSGGTWQDVVRHSFLYPHIHDIVQTYNCTCNYFCFKARQDYIEESRRIREEQDREYQESLQIDQKKEEERQRAKADQSQKEQVITITW